MVKFEITKNADGTTSFSGSFSERDLVNLTLDRFDRALVADGARNNEFSLPIACWCLSLSTGERLRKLAVMEGMMVTPEMLLFLAGKMGLPNPVAEQGECCYVEAPGVWRKFNPATDDAQFGRLVMWAAMQGLSITIWEDAVLVMPKDGDEQWQKHTNTPDSIRAAAVVAIVRALGWEGKE